MKKICFALCGAIYEQEKAVKTIKDLTKNYEIYPAISEFSAKNAKLSKTLFDITKNEVVNSIIKAEPFGPKICTDALVICPCTGNTLAKIANGISDSGVTMLAKAHQRNNRPVVVCLSTNDALGLNLFNLAKLLNSKNFYFVPFFQDDPQNKPKSLKGDIALLEKTLKYALKGKQIQPIVRTAFARA